MINKEDQLKRLGNIDSLDTYYECITECFGLAGEDIECVTQCVEVHLEGKSIAKSSWTIFFENLKLNPIFF